VQPPLAGGFSFSAFLSGFLSGGCGRPMRVLRPAEVFNTKVDKLVEKRRCIFVSDSAGNGSTFCTAMSAAGLRGDGCGDAVGRDDFLAASLP
jgi:hypothetical protein